MDETESAPAAEELQPEAETPEPQPGVAVDVDVEVEGGTVAAPVEPETARSGESHPAPGSPPETG